MAFDRDATLKKAEKLLRQGRLEPAIAEYVRVVDEFPRDWSTANTLGELYARAGQPQQAVGQYARIAQHFVDEGFYPKAAALYKKILKLQPQDETTQIQLADISARQGLLADAKSYLNAIAARRRAKGDRRGAAEIVVRLGTIDPADFEARLAAARTLEEMGEEEEAGKRFKALHDDLLEKGRTAEAIDALKEFVRINPLEREARSTLAKAALDQGDLAGAREFLDEDSAGDDPALLLPLVEIELRSGELTRAKGVLGRLLAADPTRRAVVADLGWSFVGSSPETTFLCIDAAVDSAVARVGIPAGGDQPAGVRRARAGSDSGAAQAGGSLRRRWPRAADVRCAGTADRRLPRRQPGRRGARHRRGSRRARAVGTGAHRSLSAGARHASRLRSRHAHRRAAERTGAVHGARSVLRWPPIAAPAVAAESEEAPAVDAEAADSRRGGRDAGRSGDPVASEAAEAPAPPGVAGRSRRRAATRST